MRFVVNEHNQFANEGREKVHSVGFTIFQFMIGQPIRNLKLQCKPIKASEVIIYPFYNGKFQLDIQFGAVRLANQIEAIRQPISVKHQYEDQSKF